MKNYNYTSSSSAFTICPVEIRYAKLCYEGNEVGKTIIENANGDWGDVLPLDIFSDDDIPLPNRLKLRYITKDDDKCFEINESLDTEKAERLWTLQEEKNSEYPYTKFVVGIAPYGYVAIWLSGLMKQSLLCSLKAEKVELNEDERWRFPFPPKYSIVDVILPKKKIDILMCQHCYRYIAMEEYWNGDKWQQYAEDDFFYDDIEVIDIEDKCVDGTFDYNGGLDLMSYHDAGKPSRVTIKWKEGHIYFLAHYWLDNYTINYYFEQLFKLDPLAKVNIILRIDTRANKYELALSGSEMLLRPFIIPKGGYQLLIFRDNYEFYKSENYNQEKGAWRW